MNQPCSTVVQAGNDMPVTVAIALGKTSGTFSFTYETFCIPDRFVLWYEGHVIYDTGCVQTGSGMGCLFNSPVTVPVSFSGSSTQLTVQVIPNCGGTVGTAWNFRVGCP